MYGNKFQQQQKYIIVLVIMQLFYATFIFSQVTSQRKVQIGLEV